MKRMSGVYSLYDRLFDTAFTNYVSGVNHWCLLSMVCLCSKKLEETRELQRFRKRPTGVRYDNMRY